MLGPDEIRQAGRFAYAASAEGIAFRYYPEHQSYSSGGPLRVEFMRPDDGRWYGALIREDYEHGWCFWHPEWWPLPTNAPLAVLDTSFAFSVPHDSWHHVCDCDCEYCREEALTRSRPG